MSYFEVRDYRECISCHRSFDPSHPRYSPGAMECITCSRFGPPEEWPEPTLREKLAEQYRENKWETPKDAA